MILNAPFPPDIRLEKEIGSLIASHEIFLLCTRRHGEATTEAWNGAVVTRVFTSTSARMLATFRLMTRCYSKGWRKRIEKFVDENQIQALHVHDLPLAGTALEVGRLRGIPTILDLHENYPSMLNGLKSAPIREMQSIGALGLKMTASIPRWQQYERRVAREADAVITVIEESSERVLAMGVDGARIHTVPNYSPIGSDLKKGRNNGTTAIYIGTFDQTRELNTVLEAADILSKRRLDVNIKLIGGSKREISLLQQFASRTRLNIESVSFSEWIDRKEAESLLKDAQIGLVPHVRSAHSDSTIPHKLFQYMASGLPVVASNCLPLKRIVERDECGVIYTSGNSAELAECIEKLADDPDMRGAMGRRGIEAVRNTYNWDAAARPLLELYAGINIA